MAMRIAKYKFVMGFIDFEKRIHIYNWFHPMILKFEKKLNMPNRCEECRDNFCCEKYLSTDSTYQIARCYSVDSDR
jgi:hypothetical protein